jgi:hypothetical protein
MPRHDLPKWAPRVSKRIVGRFYENDAAGLPDPELVDELAYGLLARTLSFIAAMDAVRGRAPCPICRTPLEHDHRTVRCESCDWELEWRAYFKTIQGQQLSGAEPVLAAFREYETALISASTVRAKTLAIDRLIHCWHWNSGRATRSVGVNLIEGTLTDVIEFLDQLTYGVGTSEEVLGTREDWRRQRHDSRR